MQTLQYWQEKIQAKRKQTPFRDFLLEITSWNALNLYKNNSLISVYPDVGRVGVTEGNAYNNNRDNLLTTSPDIKKIKLFDGIQKLIKVVGMPNVLGFYAKENADFANIVANSKNVYICFGVLGCENVMYSYLIKDGCSDIYNSVSVVDASSIVHSSAAVYQSHKIFYSRNIFNSNDIWFSTDLIGCNECLYCDGLENQSYCIGNEQLSKEDYFKKKEHILGEKDKFESRKQTHKPGNLGSKNCTGASIVKSEDVVNGAFLYQVNRSRNVTFSGSKNGNYELFDVHHFGSPSGNTAYAVCGGGSGVEHLYCSTHVNGGSNIYYSIYLENCSFCLGCIGLRNQEYCIFNKQYTKDEWYEKVDEIFTQMEEDGVLGNFFPGSMNRFYFNDTAACLIDPSFTKEEVTALGYLWRDEPIKVDIPDWMETVKTSELGQYEGCNDGIRTIDPVILKKVIIDEQGNNYRIVKLEYDFLMKHGLPLPRKHWLERMKENFTI